MNMKLSALAIAAAGLIVSTSASAVIVGGVDFGAFGFHIDTTTLAESGVTAAGQTTKGFGLVNTVNSNSNYSVIPGEKLYFTFTYTALSVTGANVQLGPGTVNIYKGVLAPLLTMTSDAAFSAIGGLSPWLRLAGHGNLGGPPLLCMAAATVCANGSFTGASLTFTGSGLLDVVPGGFGIPAVQTALNGNTVVDAIGGLADVLYTTSGNNFILNPLDQTDPGPGRAGNNTRCQNGTFTNLDWCFQGSADLRGALVPEPATVALVGLGLLGAGFARRRKATPEAVA